MSKPKVLLTNFHPCGVGGHTTYFQRLLAGGLDEQFDVAVAAPETSLIFRLVKSSGRRVFACDFPGNIKEIPGVIRSVQRLGKIWREFPFQILHCNGSRDHSIAVWWKVWMRTQSRIVRTHHAIRQVHDDAYHRWIHIRQTELHIYVSHAQANINEAGRALRFPASAVIVHGVDLNHFTPRPKCDAVLRELNLHADQFIFGSVAGTSTYKRPDLMLKAVARLPEKLRERAVVVVLGGESGGRQLGKLAQDLGIAGQFRFVSHQEDVRPFVTVFDVAFLLSDVVESASFAAREMMAMGSPMICSGYSGLLEVVDEGVTGFITRVGDVSAVAFAAESFLNMQPERLQQFRRAAREKAIRCFSQELLTQKTCAAYQRVLSAPLASAIE